MKNIILLTVMVLLIGLSAFEYPISNTSETESGISFFKGKFDEAKEYAKKENKSLMIVFSTEWCGYCKLLKSKTFKDEDVARFFNKHFVSINMDAEKGEGIKLSQKYSVSGYPTIVFLNSSGEKIRQAAGYRNPKSFLELGEKLIKL